MENILVYWRNETSGELAKAVKVYCTEDRELTAEERSHLAAYFRIWAFYPGWRDDTGQLEVLRQSFDAMVTGGNRATISQWLDQALVIGIDPM
ncbi:hypothetical protein [Pseudanabaena sp. FACHB-2040]|uniref:hypothetical protein n=1 Tax=Pseudanabaena sp. FACHB-2040 TaxID=2692859 RepID=UPI001684BCA4|nr:hypothetical protein [Pseudanabaena sp. FACHB-2040]MBD2261379.1 hypothetical protein [Pseudanabaena sp. FACHB-2040]